MWDVYKTLKSAKYIPLWNAYKVAPHNHLRMKQRDET